MPNDCHNSMTVSGTPEALKKFKASLELPDIQGKTAAFSFHQLVPVPEEKLNWYSWCSKNWGTKWEPYDIDMSISESEVDISFYTAWAPPAAWVKTACHKIPGLIIELSYEEPGMDFAGDIFCDEAVFDDVARECTPLE